MKLRDRSLVPCLAAAVALGCESGRRWRKSRPRNAIAAYTGLHAAAAKGDAAEIERPAAGGADVNARDGHGRTPLMVAAFHRQHAAARR